MDMDQSSRQTTDSSDDTDLMPNPTAKAMGKRRVDGSPERSEVDEPMGRVEDIGGGRSRSSSFSGSEDSRQVPRWKAQPQVYAYDAMAERTREMEEQMRRVKISERGR